MLIAILYATYLTTFENRRDKQIRDIEIRFFGTYYMHKNEL